MVATRRNGSGFGGQLGGAAGGTAAKKSRSRKAKGQITGKENLRHGDVVVTQVRTKHESVSLENLAQVGSLLDAGLLSFAHLRRQDRTYEATYGPADAQAACGDEAAGGGDAAAVDTRLPLQPLPASDGNSSGPEERPRQVLAPSCQKRDKKKCDCGSIQPLSSGPGSEKWADPTRPLKLNTILRYMQKTKDGGPSRYEQAKEGRLPQLGKPLLGAAEDVLMRVCVLHHRAGRALLDDSVKSVATDILHELGRTDVRGRSYGRGADQVQVSDKWVKAFRTRSRAQGLPLKKRKGYGIGQERCTLTIEKLSYFRDKVLQPELDECHKERMEKLGKPLTFTEKGNWDEWYLDLKALAVHGCFLVLGGERSRSDLITRLLSMRGGHGFRRMPPSPRAETRAMATTTNSTRRRRKRTAGAWPSTTSTLPSSRGSTGPHLAAWRLKKGCKSSSLNVMMLSWKNDVTDDATDDDAMKPV